MKRKKQSTGWWIVTDNAGRILRTDGSFKKAAEITFPDIEILRRQGENALAKSAAQLLRKREGKFSEGSYFLINFAEGWPGKIAGPYIKFRKKILCLCRTKVTLIDMTDTTRVKNWRI